MRETLFLLFAAGAMTLSFSAGAQQTEEFKPSGKLFGLLFADFHNTSTGGENVNVFQVTRSYFGYDYGFSKTFSSRIMFDATTQTVRLSNNLPFLLITMRLMILQKTMSFVS